MTVSDLLLEIGCEEIPSRFITGAVDQLKEAAAVLLTQQRLGYSSIDAWGTPRRLALLVSRLESRQSDLRQTVKGPPCSRAYDSNGHPTEALLGFARSQGISGDQVAVETIKGAKYVVALQEVEGQPAENLLPELLQDIVRRLNFPRPMFWQSKEFRFARPIRWLLALHGTTPLKFDFAGVTAGGATYGHRFLAPGPFELESPAHYFSCLECNHVVLNHNRRRELIIQQLEDSAVSAGGKVLIDEDLLEEVTFLVEYPVAVTGSFDRRYLDLPQEVLITTMQAHQRYFPLTGKDDDRLLPYFIGISNNRFHDNIKRGYEKVLQARLADARFFFNEDRKTSLESCVEKLQSVVYQETLGSLDQKRQRLVNLGRTLAERLHLPDGQAILVERAAHLCKADLVTHMVREFPRLQGVMGREYARLSGEPAEVAAAIYEHYLPRHAGDQIPGSLEGALISLADRIDTLTGCFAIGIQPTGSQDPYGLRRQAQGIVSVLLSRKLELAPLVLIEESLKNLAQVIQLSPHQRRDLIDSMLEFFNQRIRFAFQERELSYDVIEAVLAVPFTSMPELLQRATALEENLQSDLLRDVITAYSRVANLTRSAEGGAVNPALFEAQAEQELAELLARVEPKLKIELQNRRYSACLRLLQSLKGKIDQFFDQVMVMVEDEKRRENRLNLLFNIRMLFNELADFSLLQVGTEA